MQFKARETPCAPPGSHHRRSWWIHRSPVQARHPCTPLPPSLRSTCSTVCPRSRPCRDIGPQSHRRCIPPSIRSCTGSGRRLCDSAKRALFSKLRLKRRFGRAGASHSSSVRTWGADRVGIAVVSIGAVARGALDTSAVDEVRAVPTLARVRHRASVYAVARSAARSPLTVVGVSALGPRACLTRWRPGRCQQTATVLWQIISACVAGVHAPVKPVCGRHVAGTVVL